MTDWKKHIKGVTSLFEDYDQARITIDECAHRVADVLREQGMDDNDEWTDLIDEFEGVSHGDTEGYVNGLIAEMYDLADVHKIWIETP